MKYAQQEVNELLRKERQRASLWILVIGLLGLIVGKCSNTSQYDRNVKHGVIAPDSNKSFQPGDTIKVILIKEKQR